MLNKDFSWICNIEHPVELRADKLSEITGPYIFGGTAIVNSDQEVGKNGWGVPDDELDRFSKQFPGIQLRKDHGKSVDSVVGKVHKGTYLDGAVKFVAELGDQPLAEKVRAGYIDHVSICATADKITCSVCGKETRPKRTCACDNSHDLIRGLKLRELSLIAEAAFDSAKIVPISFSAALNEVLSEKDKTEVVAETSRTDKVEKMSEKLETKTETKTVEPTPTAVVATTEKPAGSEDSKVLLADKMEAVIKKMDEAATKHQMFWDEARKKEQMFWEKKKEDEAKKEECKKEDEDEAKKEESAPGPVPVTPIETPSVITSKPPTIVKKFAPEEDEKKEDDDDEAKKEGVAPPLSARVDTSEDTIPLPATVPTNPAELLAAALNDIRKAAVKAEIV